MPSNLPADLPQVIQKRIAYGLKTGTLTFFDAKGQQYALDPSGDLWYITSDFSSKQLSSFSYSGSLATLLDGYLLTAEKAKAPN